MRNGDIVIDCIFYETILKFEDLVIGFCIYILQEEVNKICYFDAGVSDLFVDVVPNNHSCEDIIDFVEVGLEELK